MRKPIFPYLVITLLFVSALGFFAFRPSSKPVAQYATVSVLPTATKTIIISTFEGTTSRVELDKRYEFYVPEDHDKLYNAIHVQLGKMEQLGYTFLQVETNGVEKLGYTKVFTFRKPE